jgi:hypothetical protein
MAKKGSHGEATRRNIPTAEYQSVLETEAQAPVRVAYERRNRDLDPQLVWRGKDEQDWSDLHLHMAEDLKKTDKANLFVIFGEPDPSTGEVRSDGPDGIACWFVDTDYDEESFFVRNAYFLGANDPYGALKTTLKAEIDEAAWSTLHSDTSRAVDKPKSGRIAVKVINHLGDEVMKAFRVA